MVIDLREEEKKKKGVGVGGSNFYEAYKSRIISFDLLFKLEIGTNNDTNEAKSEMKPTSSTAVILLFISCSRHVYICT